MTSVDEQRGTLPWSVAWKLAKEQLETDDHATIVCRTKEIQIEHFAEQNGLEHLPFSEQRRQLMHYYHKTHQERLNTPEFNALCKKVLKRDKYICYYCGGIAVTCHHLRYDRAGTSEEINDIVSSCKKCHDKQETSTSRQNRLETSSRI